MNKLMHLAAAFSLGWLAGCGGGGTAAAPAEEQQMRTLVGHVAEYQADPRKFAGCFAEGASADEALRKKLQGFMTRVHRATVDDAGTTATAEVLFEVLATGDQLGPVQWTLEKSGDDWKVKTLVIPDAAATGTN